MCWKLSLLLHEDVVTSWLVKHGDLTRSKQAPEIVESDHL